MLVVSLMFILLLFVTSPVTFNAPTIVPSLIIFPIALIVPLIVPSFVMTMISPCTLTVAVIVPLLIIFPSTVNILLIFPFSLFITLPWIIALPVIVPLFVILCPSETIFPFNVPLFSTSKFIVNVKLLVEIILFSGTILLLSIEPLDTKTISSPAIDALIASSTVS